MNQVQRKKIHKVLIRASKMSNQLDVVIKQTDDMTHTLDGIPSWEQLAVFDSLLTGRIQVMANELNTILDEIYKSD